MGLLSCGEAALELGSHPRQPDSGVCVLLNLELSCIVVQDMHCTRAKRDGSN